MEEAKPDASLEMPGDSPAIASDTAQLQANAGAPPSTEAVKADPPRGEASSLDAAARPIEMVAEAPNDAAEESAAAGGAAAASARSPPPK